MDIVAAHTPRELPEGSPHKSGAELTRSLRDKLAGAKNVLLVGVGGGNDSVTALLLPAQFERDFGFRPQRLQVAAMLPDVLRYSGLLPIHGEIISEITPATTRAVSGKTLKEFPEPVLAAHKQRFGIERVLGLSMASGSQGICSALHEFIEREKFDLVLACDVGGDFIATPSNLDVLSPMMDAYALDVFRHLQNRITSSEFLYCVFGLGTDGESTPEHLRDALRHVGPYAQGQFEPTAIGEVNSFYRNIVELNRRSRTADFTLKSIYGERLEPTVYRARFHTQPSLGEIKKYYGEFMHTFADEFAGRYYLFDNLDGVQNPFELHCINGIEWFVGVQRVGTGINHEMNGQSYSSVENILGISGDRAHSIFFGTPSGKFKPEQRRLILSDVAASVSHGVYDTALILACDEDHTDLTKVDCIPVSQHLRLLARKGGELPPELLAALAQGELAKKM
jgi:hypothetical protein